MRGVCCSAADIDRRCMHLFDAKERKPDQGAENVHKAVNAPKFMKVRGTNGLPMHLCFCGKERPEYFEPLLLYPFGKN